MRCEQCQKAEATVHLRALDNKGVDQSEKMIGARNQQHLCENCYDSSPTLNPLLIVGPDEREIFLRVVKVTDESLEVFELDKKSRIEKAKLVFLASRIPKQFWVVGMEFGLIITEVELKKLKGEPL